MGETQESVVHTPGPWTIRGGTGLRGEGFELTGFVSEADARLIAAAPELLEAIQAALRIEPLWMPPGDENNPEYDAEFAALAMMRNQFKAVVAKVV